MVTPPPDKADLLKNPGPTDGLVLEDLRESSVGVFPSQLPHVEERLPVDEVHQAAEVVALEHAGP